jgi:hypothetical protein
MAKPAKKPAKKELGKKDLKKTRGGLLPAINLKNLTSPIGKYDINITGGPPEPE